MAAEVRSKLTLRGERVDTLLMPELQGDYLVKEAGHALAKSTLRIEGRPSFIAISRNSGVTDARGALVGALTTMKADGTIATIIGRYR